MSGTASRADNLYDVVRGLSAPIESQFQSFIPSYIYETDGIAAVIVDRPAEDSMSRGFTIEGDEGDFVLNEMDRLDASIHLTDAVRWARLYGASAILVLMQDGLPLSAPVDVTRIRQIDDLIVYGGDQITPESMRYNDPTMRSYGTPIYYRLAPVAGDSFVVHESRLIKFSGDPLPRNNRLATRLPWHGRSALDGCRRDLQRYRKGLALSEQIMERKQQAVHSMTGLAELLGTTEGKQIVMEKISMTDAVRGIRNGITIDGGPGNGQGEGDKYQIIDLSLGGIDSVIGEYRDALAASSRISQVVLFGSDIKGLGSTGTGEQGVYHSLVRSIQERDLRPAMEALAGLLWAQSVVPASEPERWRLVFNALYSPSDKEMAEVDQARANARARHMEAVVSMVTNYLVDPDEARKAAGLAFPEMELEKGKAPEPPEMPDEEPTATTGGRTSNAV